MFDLIIVGEGQFIKLGQTQYPGIMDFADHINPLEWMGNLFPRK